MGAFGPNRRVTSGTYVRFWQIVLQKSGDHGVRLAALRALMRFRFCSRCGLQVLLSWRRLRSKRRRVGHQLGQASEVLGDGCEHELVLRAPWAT